MIKKLGFFLFFITSLTLAHIDDGDKALERYVDYCGMKSVRAAWGAMARYEGAPRVFKYVPTEQLQKYFHKGDIPNDGIYVSEDFPESYKRQYETMAGYGWDTTDQRIKLKNKPDDLKGKGYSYYVAFYLFECREEYKGKE